MRVDPAGVASVMILTRNGITFDAPAGTEDIVHEVFDEDVYRVGTIPRGSVVVDIGAHVGMFALRCALERGCTVTCFEPHPDNLPTLRANVERHGVKVVPAAVGLDGEEGELFRRVFGWSILLLLVMCVLVYLQSTAVLSWMVV